MELKSFSAESHQGPFLQSNEDGYEFDFENELFMVLDGFGGAGIGDKFVDKTKRLIKEFYTKIVLDRDATLPFYYSAKYLLEANALINAALYVHNQMYQENLKVEVPRRAGASAVLVAKSESILNILATGNCRSYLIRHGKLHQILIEDSFQFLSQDQITPHLRSIPGSGFGLFPEFHYQVKEVRVIPGDKVVVMTDGVYSRLSSEEIINEVSKPTINIKAKIQELFALSNIRGNLDNQTCLILEF